MNAKENKGETLRSIIHFGADLRGRRGENMKKKVIPTWANKPLKVSDLLKICKNAVDDGLGDKYVFISQDDEGNGFHALFFSFTTNVKDYADELYQVNDEDLEDIIILG